MNKSELRNPGKRGLLEFQAGCNHEHYSSQRSAYIKKRFCMIGALRSDYYVLHSFILLQTNVMYV